MNISRRHFVFDKKSNSFGFFKLVHEFTIISFLILQQFHPLIFANGGKSDVTSIIWSEREKANSIPCYWSASNLGQKYFGNCTQYIAFCQNQSFHKPFTFRMAQKFWRFLLAFNISLFIHAESNIDLTKFTKQNYFVLPLYLKNFASWSGLCWCM